MACGGGESGLKVESEHVNELNREKGQVNHRPDGNLASLTLARGFSVIVSF